MYELISIIGFFVRQYYFSNPFAPLGDHAEVINLIAGCLLYPLTYIMVGMIYERGSAPALGSILFTAIYAFNCFVVKNVCCLAPRIWLMVLAFCAYLVAYFLIVRRIRFC